MTRPSRKTWPADRIEHRTIASLKPYPANSRTHSDEQIGQIAASIQEWGWTQPVLIGEDDEIIAGHARVEAAKRIDLDRVPVVVARGWSEAQRRAYVIADNKLTENGGWDPTILRAEFAALDGLGFDLGMLGFSVPELAAIRGVRAGLTDPDEAPEVAVGPATASRGDLWALGRHHVLCGDCRNAADMARLVGEAEINLAFTSPPYAEQREYDGTTEFRPVPPDEYVAWFKPIAENVAHHLAADGSWFVNIKPSCEGLDTSLYVFDLVIAHVREWGWHFATEFCWERNGVPKSVTQRFKNQFEPVYQFARGRWKMRPDAVRHASENVPMPGGPGSGQTSWANAQGGVGAQSVSGSFGAAKKRRRNGTSQLMSDVQGTNVQPGEFIGPGFAYPGNRLPTFMSSHEATGHTAAFPVGLPEFFCKAYSDAGDTVLDPFLGSGSTLMAAHISNRIGYGCEISPAYVDVAIIRWQNFTGERATLDGQTFDQVRAARQPVAA